MAPQSAGKGASQASHQRSDFDYEAQHPNWFLDAQVQLLADIERHVRFIRSWVAFFALLVLLALAGTIISSIAAFAVAR